MAFLGNGLLGDWLYEEGRDSVPVAQAACTPPQAYARKARPAFVGAPAE